MKFIGSFNKKANLIESQAIEKYGYTCEFDQEMYLKTQTEIFKILGKKKKYLGIDAYAFFRKRYLAFPIDITRYYDFLSTDTDEFCFSDNGRIKDDIEIEALNDDFGSHYHYISNTPERENNITLAIEIKQIFNKFPEIEKDIKTNAKKFGYIKRKGKFFDILPDGTEQYLGDLCNNVIIAIGSVDNKTINSMKILYGEHIIYELGYAMEFFRRHS